MVTWPPKQFFFPHCKLIGWSLARKVVLVPGTFTISLCFPIGVLLLEPPLQAGRVLS